MLSSDEVLMRVRAAGANDRFRVTALINEQLRDRGLTVGDVRSALSGARVSIDRGDGTFRVGGTDLDGAALSLIVTLEEDSIEVISEAGR